MVNSVLAHMIMLAIGKAIIVIALWQCSNQIPVHLFLALIFGLEIGRVPTLHQSSILLSFCSVNRIPNFLQ